MVNPINRRVPLNRRKLPSNPQLERERKLIETLHVPNCFIPVDTWDFNVDTIFLRQPDPRCRTGDCNIIQPKCGRCRGRMRRVGRYIY